LGVYPRKFGGNMAARNDERDRYLVHIEGRWSLEDLYVFPRAYEQVYFAVYSMLPGHDEIALERIHNAYRAFPWQGGYSAVNFYNQLKYVTPSKERPEIASIQYHSPGWIELVLLVGVALAVEKIVRAIASSIDHANGVYDRIVRGLQERKLLRLEAKRKQLEFRKAELQFIKEASEAMASLFGFKNLNEIHERTGHPYLTLKILLSLYRRIRTLVQYEEKGKATLRNKK
jgi:hypothetical protein